MGDVTNDRVRRILLQGAAEAYIGFPESAAGGIPIDRRCSMCGVERTECDWQGCLQRELRENPDDDWPVHQPIAPDAPIPGRHWYGGCEPGGDWDSEYGRYTGTGPRVNPATGICEGCGEKACPECGAGFYPDGGCQCVPDGQMTFQEVLDGD